MATNLIYADEFFAVARERYQIKLRREAGQPPPWTTDPHLAAWRFCQVHREDDRTTVWFRDNIRDPLSQRVREKGAFAEASLIELLEATLIFRWFNRIETGECIKDLLLYGWDTKEARERLTGISPIVTGAFIIKAGDGVSKLEGILNCIDQARPKLPQFVNLWLSFRNEGELELKDAWEHLKTLNYMGGFMSYEVVSDLRWTPLLENAIDIMTWANAGPGCARGLGWLTTGDSGWFNCGPKDQKVMLTLMQEILELSKNPNYWPQDWKPWEMREAEHWNCEYDKYKRAQSGDRLKRRYS